MNNTYTLTVFNTCTNQYEEIEVTKAVYDEYRRGEWRIDRNDRKHKANEINFTELKGGIDDAFERFKEFINAENDPVNDVIQAEHKRMAYEALACLTDTSRTRFFLHFRDGYTVKQIAQMQGVTEETVKTTLERARKRIDKIIKNF